MEHKCLE
ncbi:hypothetical protein CGLO_14116 [Colletotrichum gloeosporioides Cg-14]|nr:hypothetical protein CGLO_14116 [Colletotrichum gloeosporioides Cg-14]